MRICRVVSSFTNSNQCKGDIVPLFYNQSKHLTDMGYDIHIVCGREKGQLEFEEIDDIKVHRVSPIQNRRSYLFGEFARSAYQKIIELNPRIIHGDTSVHFGLLGKKKKLNTPIVTQLHSILDGYKYMDYLPYSYNLKEAVMYRMMIQSYFYENKYMLNKSNYIIAVSEAAKSSIKKYVDNDFINVIYNGVDPDEFMNIKTSIKEIFDADKIILYTGRPAPVKGIPYLIEATKTLNQEFENMKVLLVGTHRKDMELYSNWIANCIKESGANNIYSLESVHQNLLNFYYSAADCFVLPSTSEACSLSLLEAQSCECPVVATNTGGNPEIVGKESGLLCNSKSSVDLAEKISFVLNNKNKFNGREFASKFTWKKSAESLAKFYEEIDLNMVFAEEDRFAYP